MRQLIAVALFCAGLFCIAQAQVPMTGAGLGAPGGAGPVCVSYTGPGDSASSAKAFWGVRSYTAATCGNKLLNVCDPTGAVCADFVSSTSTGDLVFQTVNGTACGTTDTCVVKTAYDLTGNGFDVTQSTNAKRPTLKHNCTTNNRPCLVGVSGVELGPAGSAISQAQPFTIPAVAIVTAAATSQVILGDGVGITQYYNSTTTCDVFAGNGNSASCTSTSWNSFQGQFNGTSSAIIHNGTTSAVSLGTTSFGTPIVMSDGTNPMNTGSLAEVGLWPGTINIYSNQSAWYGGF